MSLPVVFRFLVSAENSKLTGRAHLARALREYAARHPAERACADAFADFVSDEPRCYERDCWRGHVTGAAWLVNLAGTHVLLTHHRKLDLWLQLGGHSDGDPDVRAVAFREATEESGLRVKLLDDAIYDIDIHDIPARRDDPAHRHFDVRFAMQVVDSERYTVSAESHDLAWVPIDNLAPVTSEPTILRMAEKWMFRQSQPPC